MASPLSKTPRATNGAARSSAVARHDDSSSSQLRPVAHRLEPTAMEEQREEARFIPTRRLSARGRLPRDVVEVFGPL
eukprot:IDg1068t1